MYLVLQHCFAPICDPWWCIAVSERGQKLQLQADLRGTTGQQDSEGPVLTTGSRYDRISFALLETLLSDKRVENTEAPSHGN
jgi:hypothetical protein